MQTETSGFTVIEFLFVVVILGVMCFAVWLNIRATKERILAEGQSPAIVAEAWFPEPTNYAVDTAGVLSADQIRALNEKLEGIANEDYQFGVVIVKTTFPHSIEQYAAKLARKWGVSADIALIIIATEDGQERIQVGYGLQGEIPESVADSILDTAMVPHFKDKNWHGGIVAGLDALVTHMK